MNLTQNRLYFQGKSGGSGSETGTLSVNYSKTGTVILLSILEYRIDNETEWRMGSFTEETELILPVGTHKIIFHTTLGLENYTGQFSVGEHSQPITTAFNDVVNKELTFEIAHNETVYVYAHIVEI